MNALNVLDVLSFRFSAILWFPCFNNTQIMNTKKINNHTSKTGPHITTILCHNPKKHSWCTCLGIVNRSTRLSNVLHSQHVDGWSLVAFTTEGFHASWLKNS